MPGQFHGVLHTVFFGGLAEHGMAQQMSGEVDLLVLRQSSAGLIGDPFEGIVDVLTGKLLASTGTDERSGFGASYFVDISVERFPGVLGQEDLPGNLLTFAFDVQKVLVLILVEIETQQLRNAKPRVKEHQKDGEISNRRLVPAATDVNQLFGGGFQPGNVDVSKAFPLGIVDIEFMDAVAGVAGEKRALAMDPVGRVPKSSQATIDRGGTLTFASFQVLQIVCGQRTGPLVGMVAAGRIEEEGEEMAEVTFLGVQRVRGTGGAFQRQVQVEPGDQTLAFVGRD